MKITPERQPSCAADPRGSRTHGTVRSTGKSVLIADVGGRPVARSVFSPLAMRLRRRGVVVAVCDCSATADRGFARLSAAVRRVLDSGECEPPVLVLFGDDGRQRRLFWTLALSGLLPALRLVVHAAAAEIPYEPSSAHLFSRADLVVTESGLGSDAVERCCEEAAMPAPEVVVIPPAFPSLASHAQPAATGRRASRRELFGVEDGALLVGSRTGDGPEEVPPLVLRIFRMFTRGYYWRCRRCDYVSPWDEDEDLAPRPCAQCARCGSANGAPGQPRDDARLYLTGEPAIEDGLWRTRTIGARVGLEDRIIHEGELPAIRSAADRAERWRCVDVHLQPHVLAEVPDSMRMSCALGVPIVATRYGAVQEWLGGVAGLVSPRLVVDHATGHRIALIDTGGAVAELCRLAADRTARQVAAGRGRELARGHGAKDSVTRWIELLEERTGAPGRAPHRASATATARDEHGR